MDRSVASAGEQEFVMQAEREAEMKRTEIMYIERKDEGLTGPGRIGRVTFSKTGKTIYYKDAALQSLKGQGYKANYYDIETFEWYWVSKPKKGGQDTLYSGVVEVDEDVREEYWSEIRGLRDLCDVTVYRSEGKHAGWRAEQFQR